MELNKIVFALLSLATLLAFSDVKSEVSIKAEKKKLTKRNIDPLIYSKGQKLYQLNCAECHGQQGEGAKDWRTPDKDGKNQPPPLNGSGHTWHHSPKALILVINNGTSKIGGNMPAWKDKLSKSEIKLILTWITSQWSDEIYTAWYNQHHRKN